MRGRRASLVAAWMIVVGGTGLALIHYFGGSPHDPEGWFAAAGFSAPFVGVGALSLIGIYRSRPGLLIGVSGYLTLMSIVSIVLFPFIGIAALLIVQAAKNELRANDVMIGLLLGAPLPVTFGFLIFHQDPATWAYATGGGSSSNIVTGFEATLSLAITAQVIAAANSWTRRLAFKPHIARG